MPNVTCIASARFSDATTKNILNESSTNTDASDTYQQLLGKAKQDRSVAVPATTQRPLICTGPQSQMLRCEPGLAAGGSRFCERWNNSRDISASFNLENHRSRTRLEPGDDHANKAVPRTARSFHVRRCEFRFDLFHTGSARPGLAPQHSRRKAVSMRDTKHEAPSVKQGFALQSSVHSISPSSLRI